MVEGGRGTHTARKETTRQLSDRRLLETEERQTHIHQDDRDRRRVVRLAIFLHQGVESELTVLGDRDEEVVLLELSSEDTSVDNVVFDDQTMHLCERVALHGKDMRQGWVAGRRG